MHVHIQAQENKNKTNFRELRIEVNTDLGVSTNKLINFHVLTINQPPIGLLTQNYVKTKENTSVLGKIYSTNFKYKRKWN